MQVELPFSYQVDGAKWLTENNYCLLADDMGLGKSRQCVMASTLVEAKKILIICPAIARPNWQNEFNKWSPHPVNFKICYTLKDSPSPSESAIVSFDYAAQNKDSLRMHDWDLLIIDECHFIKSVEAKRTAAIYGTEGIIRKAKRCWALSGTPAPNHAGELWPLLYTFGVTKLKYDSFVKRYCNTYLFQRRLQITGTKTSHIPELKLMLDKVMLRRTKSDVNIDLPPLSFGDIVVDGGHVDLVLNPSFQQYIFPTDRRSILIEKLEEEKKLIMDSINLVKKRESHKPHEELLRTFSGIAQSVSTLRRYTGVQKVDPVAEIVKNELESNAYDKIVIFAIHRDVIEGIRLKLSKYHAVTVYGGTNPETRVKNIKKFQTNPKCRVFVGNIGAVGTAINLTVASQVLFVEQDWVPGNNAQAAMRCHRVGQKNPVFVRIVSLTDSIDQKVNLILKKKAKEIALLTVNPENFDDQEL